MQERPATTYLSITLSLFAILLSASLAYLSDRDLQRKSQASTYASEVVKARMGLLTEATSLFAEGRRLSLLSAVLDDASRTEFVRMISCAANVEKQKDGITCKPLGASENLLDRLKDATALQARFEALTAASQLWFCGGTQEALRRVPSGGFWWDGQDDPRKVVLNTMKSEILCDLPKDELSRPSTGP